MFLGNYGDIDAENTSCQVYYIIIVFSSPCKLQKYLNIVGNDIYFDKMVCEGNYPPQ